MDPTFGVTNFAKMQSEELAAWSKSFWKRVRRKSVLTRYTGTTENSMVQRITELRKDKKGTRAIITLLHDAQGDGVAGDRRLKGNEEKLRSSDMQIRIDQLRKAHTNEGRIAEQKALVSFRKAARDSLSVWMADRIDQLGFHHLSGVDTTVKLDGTPRVGSDFPLLEFNADIAAPTAGRHFRWDVDAGGNTLETGNTGNVEPGDMPSWEMLVMLKAIAQDLKLKPIRGDDLGLELFHVFMSPLGIAALKMDDNFMTNWRESMPRTPNHPLFKGAATMYVDGLAIHSTEHVYHPSDWGGGGDVKGQRVLFCGSQALGYADLGAPSWDEEYEDYNNAMGIALGKILGFRKSQFPDEDTGNLEDFSVLCCDTAVRAK
jgi:hypothetical protein